MSYIFDALQRSRAERSKTGELTCPTATELLDLAEHEARAQSISDFLQGSSPDAFAKSEGSPFNDPGSETGPRHADPIATSKTPEGNGREDIFHRFRALDISDSGSKQLVCLHDIDDPASEAFRFLGIRLRNLRAERKFTSLLITSTVPKEGKSVVAANLACTLGCAAKGKVLLLEGDLRRPAQADIFGLTKLPGLCNYLMGEGDISANLYRLPKAGIWLLPAGNSRGDIPELLASSHLPSMLTKLNSWFDWIVVDAPPVLPLVDTSIWSRLVDRILLVARQGTTRRQTLEKGLKSIDLSKMVGALLNASKNTRESYQYYYESTSNTATRRQIEML